MRRVIYGVACTVDGFLAGPGGEIDWLQWTTDAQQVMAAFWPRVDTIIMGRKTYEAVLSLGSVPGGMPGIRAAYVFSRTLTATAPGIQLVTRDAIDFVRALKEEEEGKDICLWGGGAFAGTLIGAGLVDEVSLNIHPLLLGSGIPVFVGLGRRLPLRLLENRSLQGGCVLATYVSEAA
jgi:dihydrofolate reductase